MDYSALGSLISSVGFPIVIAFVLIWYIKEEQDKMRETLTELKTAISRLIDRIDKIGDASNGNSNKVNQFDD